MVVMGSLSLDLRRRIVEAYRKGLTTTYEKTAEMFDVGRATVNRLLRRERETGDVHYKPRGGNNPRKVNLEWLKKHALENPDARIVDRISAWKQHSGISVSSFAMRDALRAIGFSYKKRRP
jgi:transposase